MRRANLLAVCLQNIMVFKIKEKHRSYLARKTYILENFFNEIGIVNSKQIDMKKLAEKNSPLYLRNLEQVNYVKRGAVSLLHL